MWASYLPPKHGPANVRTSQPMLIVANSLTILAKKEKGREIGVANLPKKQPAVCLPILQLVVK
jgi:hypothetical protein